MSATHFARTLAVQTVVIIGLALIAPALAVAADDNDWPGFRGPRGDGVYTQRAFSDRDGFSLTVAWKRTLGSAYSGVAIADGRVITMFSDGTSDVMIAMSEDTGEELWRFVVAPTYAGHDGSHTGAIATPLVAGDRVFGLAPRGRFFALDAATGKVVWTMNLVEDQEATEPHYGFSTSPMMLGGVLIAEIGAKDGAIAGFDPATGKRLWTAGSDTITYQSPISWTFQGRKQVVAAADKKLFGIDAKTGNVLWEYVHGGGGAIGAGSVTPVPAGDGRLLLTHKDRATAMIELTQTGETDVAKQLWESRSIRNTYNVPVYHKGYIYGFSSRFLTCVDATTGDSVWRSRAPGDGFVTLVDGHLVIITKAGGLHIAQATPEGYTESAHLSVFADQAWSPLSFANGHVYLRSLGEIARVDIRSGAAGTTTPSVTRATSAGSKFGRFLAEVGSATDKKAIVDRFMAANKVFPVIEGREQVHFVYRGSGDDLAVAGDMFGARQERVMNRVDGTDLFYFSTRLEADARVNYLFIKDFEEHLVDPRNPRKTSTAVYTREMEMSFSGAEMAMSWLSMPDWKEPTFLQEPSASRRGRVESREFKSKLLGAKTEMDVYLPAGYSEGVKRYPVAYVHGGAFFRKQGHLPTALDNLIGTRIDPLIVVFINTMPGRDPGKYPEMVAKEMIPYIDQAFRTIPSADARAYVGAGMTSLVTLLSALSQPGTVGKVGCLSPLIFDQMAGPLLAAAKASSEQPIDIFIEWGKYGLRNPDEAWDLPKSNRTLVDKLRANGHNVVGSEIHDGTGWSSWRNRTDVLFENLFPKRK